MAKKPRRLTGYLMALPMVVAVQPAWASLKLLSGPPTCTHVGNLVTNCGGNQ